MFEVLIYFEHSSTKINTLFNRGEIDWIGNPFTYDIPIPHPKVIQPSLYHFFIYFNTTLFPLSSPSIRQAFSKVLDRRFLSQHISLPNNPLFTFLPESMFANQLKLIDSDVEAGQELFQQGLKELGLTRKTFPTLKISSSTEAESRQIFEYLQQTWQKAFGIKIELEVDDWNTFYAQLVKGNYQIGGFFKGLFALDSTCFWDSFAIKDNNFSRWEDQGYAENISLMKKTESETTKVNCFKKAEKFLLNHAPAIPLLSLRYHYTHKEELTNYTVDPEGTVDFRFAFIQNKHSENLACPFDQNKPPLNSQDKRGIACDSPAK